MSFEVKHLQKKFGDKQAVEDLSFELRNPGVYALLGTNGAGKSTFINSLSTIDMPTRGKVYINDVEVRTMSEIEIGRFRYENLGFIFQEFNLLDSLTIRENIAVPLSLASFDKDEINARIEKMAERLDIRKTLDRTPGECSGGQRQRAAIARALISEPKLIVADEPTGNLDSKNSHEILQLFRELNEVDGVSILMVTHDSMIASYSSKVLYIKDGVIDTEIIRGDMNQRDYFHKIVDINSEESQRLFMEEEA